MKDRIYINLLFVEQVRKHIPYKKFHMFYIIYEIEVIIDEIRFRLTIDYPTLEKWGITVEELDKIAMENSMRDLPAILRTYRDSVNMEEYNLLQGDEAITPERLMFWKIKIASLVWACLHTRVYWRRLQRY